MRKHLAPDIDVQKPSFGPTPLEMSPQPPWALSAFHHLAHQTQWVVFEPQATCSGPPYIEWLKVFFTGNGETVAPSVLNRTISIFVTCERSTMTQNDFDTGRFVCLVSIAFQRLADQ